MSTINKTFLRVLLAIACCIALAFSLLPQAEAAMRADVVTGKVTLNGQVIDNKNAKYPLLTYSNITYFPMTYQLSRFMGVETDWNNAAKSLNITAGGAQSAYVAEPGKAPRGSVSVTLPSYKVYINSALSNDVDDTWPIFNYNGVTSTAHRSITRKKSISFSIITASPISPSPGPTRSIRSVGAISGTLKTVCVLTRPPLPPACRPLPTPATPRSTRHSRSSTANTPRAANTTACLKAAARRRASTPRSTSAAHRMSPP